MAHFLVSSHLQFWHLNTLSIILFLVSLSTFFFSVGPDSPFNSLSFLSLHFLCIGIHCFYQPQHFLLFNRAEANKPISLFPLLFLRFLPRFFKFLVRVLVHHIQRD